MRFLHASFEQSAPAHSGRMALSQHRSDREPPGREEGESQMGIRQTFKKWTAYQQTVRELAALDNRQLNDLGITRADIQKIAREHARAL
jgi:uncharacterized protein YjiS (DUF1127 family)